jgi:hypothetical protein
MGRTCTHYSVSIVRDRGLDLNALAFIRARHADHSITFVDGWTGKGVIGRELRQSVLAFNALHGAAIRPELFVLADIAGTADFAATREDYLIPSAVLNSTVSGLVSRTVLSDEVGAGDFHGCVLYEHLRAADRSSWFVDQVSASVARAPARSRLSGPSVDSDALERAVRRLMADQGIEDINRVKPGVGETTRVMLRRMPQMLLVRDAADPDTLHLIHLAQQRNAPVTENPDLPCKALAIIEKAD